MTAKTDRATGPAPDPGPAAVPTAGAGPARPGGGMRRVLTYLLPVGPVGDGAWRLGFRSFLALVGPGSVPFALVLFGAQNQLMRTDYLIAWGPLIAVATGAAVVLARFRPVEAWLLVMLALVGTALEAEAAQWEPWPLSTPSVFALLVVLFALGRDRRAWAGVLCWLGYALAGAWATWAVAADRLEPVPDVIADQSPNPGGDNLLLGLLLGAIALIVGMTVRIWRQGRSRVAEEGRVAEGERQRRRLLEERARIARELHDVVAHHMSVIAVQSATAEYRVEGLSEDAKAEFRSIGAQARESLAEMRRLLGVLRREDETGARAPQPGPEALRGLAEAVERAGTPVDLVVGDLPEDLPETVALTVFRVVQEALSNVVRHAPGAAARVSVTVGDRTGEGEGAGSGGAVGEAPVGTAAAGAVVEVLVVNGPPPGGPAAPVADGSGFGLVGMRERVALDRGALEAGPTAEGGFRVAAVLPIRSAAEESA